MKIAIVSLGCPKNQVDADVFCRALLEDGHETVAKIDEADLILVNTCGFLDAAKEEAIEHILDACRLKKDNPKRKVMVTGCLAERYREELAKEIPELDAVVGIGKNARLPEIVRHLMQESNMQSQPYEAYGPKTDLAFSHRRVIGTPSHFAYLKVAEGCSNVCSYCAIPSIRGPFRSRSLASCLEEARWLAQQGVKELVLVAQDVTAFGEDRGKNEIVALLDALNAIEGICWIRILYAYPERITDAFLEAMKRNEKVLPYLDLPIQHCNDTILQSMRRKGGAAAVRQAIAKIRKNIPHCTLRTSLIVGYPSESEEQFEELCRFVKETEFDRLGCFAYSQEEGTKAAEMTNQVPQEVRERRAEIMMEMQAGILKEKQEKQIGATLLVLCDGFDDEENAYVCRGESDCYEIDTLVYVHTDMPMQQGRFYKVKVHREDGFDLHADCVEEAHASQ